MGERVELVPPDPDQLPLGFDMGEHLRGEKDAMRDADSGRRLAGRALDERLGRMGQGLKTVTFTGSFNPPGSDPRELREWSQSFPVPGRLDARTLGYMAHAAARGVNERKVKGDTPPQVYTTGVIVEEYQAPPAPKRRAKRRPVVRQYVTFRYGKRPIYRDRKTGRFTSKQRWETE